MSECIVRMEMPGPVGIALALMIMAIIRGAEYRTSKEGITSQFTKKGCRDARLRNHSPKGMGG